MRMSMFGAALLVCTPALATAGALECDISEVAADGTVAAQQTMSLPLVFGVVAPYDDPDRASGESAYEAELFCRTCPVATNERGVPLPRGAIIDFTISRALDHGYLRVEAAAGITPGRSPHYIIGEPLATVIADHGAPAALEARDPEGNALLIRCHFSE